MANTYPWLRLLSTYREGILRELFLVGQENESVFQGVSGLTDAQQQLQSGLTGFFDQLTPHIRSQLLSSGTPSDLEFGPLMAKMNQVLEEVRARQAPPDNTAVLEAITALESKIAVPDNLLEAAASFEVKAAEVLEAAGRVKPDSETEPAQAAIIKVLSSLFTVTQSQGDRNTELLAKILELVSGADEDRKRALDLTCNELGGLLHRQLSFTIAGYEQRQGNRRPSRPYATALIEIFERVSWVFTNQDAQQLQGLVDHLKNLMGGNVNQPSAHQPKPEPVHEDVNGLGQTTVSSETPATTPLSETDPPQSSELILVSVDDDNSLFSKLTPQMQELLNQAREAEDGVVNRRDTKKNRRRADQESED